MGKTKHPSQFPVELIKRLVLSLSNEGDCVFDLFLGAKTSVIAAVRHGHKSIGAESRQTSRKKDLQTKLKSRNINL